MAEGQASRVTEETILTVDLWDDDYPITDLVTESGYLIRSDGYNTTIISGTTCSGNTCSGLWWTNWITPEGLHKHRLHYKPEDLFRWHGLREQTFTVVIPNTNLACYIENRFEYKLYVGGRIYWNHQKYYHYKGGEVTYNPFEYNRIIPVFIYAKTQSFLPGELKDNCVFWITKPYQKDLIVKLEPRVIKKDLEVTLFAHNYYLLYDEDVQVRIVCEDMQGNEMDYTFTFHTEERP